MAPALRAGRGRDAGEAEEDDKEAEEAEEDDKDEEETMRLDIILER